MLGLRGSLACGLASRRDPQSSTARACPRATARVRRCHFNALEQTEQPQLIRRRHGGARLTKSFRWARRAAGS
eukprot:5184121-Prymnesium_polylepis.1